MTVIWDAGGFRRLWRLIDMHGPEAAIHPPLLLLHPGPLSGLFFIFSPLQMKISIIK